MGAIAITAAVRVNRSPTLADNTINNKEPAGICRFFVYEEGSVSSRFTSEIVTPKYFLKLALK